MKKKLIKHNIGFGNNGNAYSIVKEQYAPTEVWYRKYIKKITGKLMTYGREANYLSVLASPDKTKIFTLDVKDDGPSLGIYDIKQNNFQYVLHTLNGNNNKVYLVDWNISAIWSQDNLGVYIKNTYGVSTWWIDIVHKSISKVFTVDGAYWIEPSMYDGHHALLFKKMEDSGYWMATEKK